MEMKQEPIRTPTVAENFGPPRDHSVIVDGVHPMEVRPLEGRVGIVSEINPDAEIVDHPDEEPEHHVISVN